MDIFSCFFFLPPHTLQSTRQVEKETQNHLKRRETRWWLVYQPIHAEGCCRLNVNGKFDGQQRQHQPTTNKRSYY